MLSGICFLGGAFDVEENVVGVVCCLSGRQCPRCCMLWWKVVVIGVVCFGVEGIVLCVVCLVWKTMF